jgi:hypothetical protein
MKKMLMLEEAKEVPEMTEDSGLTVLGYRLEFLNENATRILHRLDVRSINLQDLTRHLKHRESVLIRPKLRERHVVKAKGRSQETWYIAHV